MGKKGTEITFEEQLGALEQVVNDLERENLPLAEAVQKFEQGMKLATLCNQQLAEAQQLVEKIVKENSELFEKQPFAPSEKS